MMSAQSAPNLQQAGAQAAPPPAAHYKYLPPERHAHYSVPTPAENSSPPPTPPVRDSSSLKGIKYGPGHEKFPSWPVPAAAEAPAALRGPPAGGSHRSKSWTDHTNYPKEKVVTYTRPYMKRQHSVYTKQLKTVMEKCEKIPAETFESRIDKVNERLYYPRVDREGKALGDVDYMVPSPPERDIAKPQLTQADLEEYARSYQEPSLQTDIDKYSQSYQDVSSLGKNMPHLTQADLEEYTRTYEEALSQHQKQPSYAQSEGYHSYVSSTDSTATPFLDRLRRDSEATVTRPQSSVWDDSSEQEREVRHEGRDSVVTTSSGSVSSSETLKWHGSMSDVSVASSSCTHLANSSSSRQQIAHSARVQTPQRHHSESVLYMGGERQQDGWKDKENRNNHHNQLKLFPVNTYTVQPTEQQHAQNVSHRSSMSSQRTVADRVNELERQTKYTYLDPEKKHRVSDPTLKAIQKKALLSYYERHHATSSKSSWRSEPQLAQSAVPQAPQPPPRPQPQTPSRRASCASDYASSIRKSNITTVREAKPSDCMKSNSKHQHSSSCSSLSADLLGPVIMGPAISIDDWVPERPPKNPHLRTAFPDLFQEPRVPSPDLPPPSPPTVLEDEVFHNDEPLPPPPTDIETAKWNHELTGSNSKVSPSKLASNAEEVHCQTNGLPDHGPRFSNIRMSQRCRPLPKSENSIPLHPSTNPFIRSSSNQRQSFIDHTKRHSQKLVINGSIAVSQKVSNGLPEPFHTESLRACKPPAQLPSNEEKRKPPAQLPNDLKIENRPGAVDLKSAQRASLAEQSEPPPLHPRQTRINQSMRARIPDSSKNGAVTRNSPPKFIEKREDDRNMNYMSQSKASYLAARREREHGLPTADIGSYKRTMSPSGGGAPLHDTSKDIDTPHWAVTHSQPVLTKDSTLIRNNNNNNNNSLMRRTSLVESKCNGKKDSILTVVLKPCADEKKCVLPDVLPVNAKVSPTRMSPPRTSPQISPTRVSPPRVQLIRSISEEVKPLERLCLVSTPPRSPPKSMSPTTLPVTKPKSPPSSPKVSPKTSPVSSPQLPVITSPKVTDTPTSKSPVCTSPVSSPVKPLSPVQLTFEVCESNDQPKVIEGLQMIQRTEVTLRVNTCTIDAASQTEKEELPSTPLPTRRKLQEEIDCERLSQDLVNHLSPSDRLKCILVPGPEHKKSSDYVSASGLFKMEVTSRPRPQNSPFRSRTSTPSESPPPSINTSVITTTATVTSHTDTTTNTTVSQSTTTTTTTTTTSEITVPILEPSSPVSATSTYCTTSDSKTKFLTRYSRDMNQYNIVKDTKDLNQKKEELVNRLGKKLEVLRGEQLVVSEECRMNDELGENVERHVSRLARPHELAKFRVHVHDIGRITNLLLVLSGHLARTENALVEFPPEDEEQKKILEEKRDKLQEKLEEAKILKETIDKRGEAVSNILYQYLNSEEYADYDHFINMKAKLIMESREISDKILLGQQQLNALKETLNIND